ncbi:hypothetical protein ENSA5_65190 [Enhygromyxa salina]|uniref:Uncharacterized protein n=1 Tax=Enhygromyxa salina TaxID=215803 RepID=A0A2S9XC44_9BACT|nr:FxLYD domain-containing protein [Enhygromyxa salina]PRP90427.1 hypothetical protein ENSA5_65190 [Enhygromyxa salina]
MSTQPLVCPSCHGPAATGPDANGEYRCDYCGTRFRRAAAPAEPAPVVVKVSPTADGGQRTTALLLGLLVAIVGLSVAGAMFWLGAQQDHESASPSSPRTASASTPSRLSAEPKVVAPRDSVAVQAPAAAEPEPEAPASASFEFHRNQSGYKESYYALGIVENTSPFVIDKPKVTAVLLDADGKELGTKFGFATRGPLGPGDSSPVKILIDDPPAHDSVRFEVAPRKASYVPPQVEGLRVEPGEPRPAKYGDDRWEIDGKVFNDGAEAAKFVAIEIQALDADGKLMAVHSTFADADLVAPGDEARFSTGTFAAAGEVDHFEFSVAGMPGG